MATSGAFATGLKKSPEEVSLKNSSSKGKLPGAETGLLKQSSALDNSRRKETDTVYDKQLKGVGRSTASGSSQIVNSTVSRQAASGDPFSQASEIHTEKPSTSKQVLRGAGSSQALFASEGLTLKQALRDIGPSPLSKASPLEKLTLKQALRGASHSHSSSTAAYRQLSRGAEEADTKKQTLNVAADRQFSRGEDEADTKKQISSAAVVSQSLAVIGKQQSDGASTSQNFAADTLDSLSREVSCSNVFEGGSLKESTLFGTFIPSASGTAQLAEGASRLPQCSLPSSLEAAHKYSKLKCEPENECIWDSSLPPSGSLSPQSSINGSGIVTGASSVKNSSSANISESIINGDKFSAANNCESTKPSGIGDSVESAKSSVSRGSNSSGLSDDSTWSNLTASVNKPHKANDPRWEAILVVRKRDGILGLSHFRLLKRLGCGDIGSVYLSELSGTKCYFAMKVMDKASLASRKKLLRAQTEREILQSLDHPFLPTLYTHFETDKFSCLVMEFCPGGDLHTLRQRQPGKHFSELAARFYAAEVLLGLEYLHMLGVVYRDLKPENVLVREDGHIMLSDFDLSLRCAVSPTLVKSSSVDLDPSKRVPAYCVQPACIEPSCVQPVCIQPSCVQPSCFVPRFFPQRSKKVRKPKVEIGTQVTPLPELIAEPTSARSMSFVGTHEYLAPEIIKGEGHGSAVDWWTFGIFLHELIFGKTPFKGSGNRATLFNVVGQPLRFPESPIASFAARDLIRGLLVKEPQHRLAFKRGATEIKQHPFFEGVNWALIRCTTPPEIPKPFETELPGKTVSTASSSGKKIADSDSNASGNYLDFDFF
ncbi:hypothetical protein SUGI_0582940 [Cryptomeria japonica]|uniref:serine/threonine-protein kinase D6PK n=1 Tax=Cryptomeria japonica TaxID=3369 RepID=UPI00241492DF|nr:serine/threonine-protein kinase D6PK [Cryptomeria japonica]XP_057861531.1 serine/threonine-protein kinase D6PK [Cryptomeria japonica]XP_057861532.1 serine/threonine-protein kinase D6PK [Cryptomeria japonica]GLJ29556.1 hypothetical protein SUGI_0582940 [Cryptomeria japonica]